jgi:hypothetical protein
MTKRLYLLPNGTEMEMTPVEYANYWGRVESYDIATQLELIYKDIQSGFFGEQAKTGEFSKYIMTIKNKYPKASE